MKDRKLTKKEIREKWYEIAKAQNRLESIKRQRPIKVKVGKTWIVIEPLNPFYQTAKYFVDYEEV